MTPDPFRHETPPKDEPRCDGACGSGVSDQQATERFLSQLPVLPPDSTMQFDCQPGVRCFNACCNDLNLVLSPYDVLRLRRALDLPSSGFLERYTDVGSMPETGFPLRHLRMRRDAAGNCPFVREAGCSLYDDRPAACRTYPLGRTAELDGNGKLVETIYVVQESHCAGFEAGRAWTGEAWLRDQGLAEFNHFSDRYMTIISRWGERGTPLTAKQHQVVDMALYRLDRFRAFLADAALLDRLKMTAARRAAILADDEERLRFALDWLELILFRTSAVLLPR